VSLLFYFESGTPAQQLTATYLHFNVYCCVGEETSTRLLTKVIL